MEIKKSIMELIGFNVLETDVKMILPENKNEVFDPGAYQVDIDFEIKYRDDDDEHLIVMEIIVNQAKLIGYYARLLCATHLKFNQKIAEDEKQQLLFSGVSMSITNARAFLTNITSYNIFYPQYILPAIDMNQLIQDKVNTQENKKSDQ